MFDDWTPRELKELARKAAGLAARPKEARENFAEDLSRDYGEVVNHLRAKLEQAKADNEDLSLAATAFSEELDEANREVSVLRAKLERAEAALHDCVKTARQIRTRVERQAGNNHDLWWASGATCRLEQAAEKALAKIGSAPAQTAEDTTPGPGCDSRCDETCCWCNKRWCYCYHPCAWTCKAKETP